MRGYDVDTGKLAWTNAAKAFNTYGSLFRVKSGGDLVAAFQWGFFTRVRDGQAIWDKGAFGDSVATPIVEGDTIFAHGGYPQVQRRRRRACKAFKIPASTDSGKLTVAYELQDGLGRRRIRGGQEEEPVRPRLRRLAAVCRWPDLPS